VRLDESLAGFILSPLRRADSFELASIAEAAARAASKTQCATVTSAFVGIG
jgi:hypothetical protein